MRAQTQKSEIGVNGRFGPSLVMHNCAPSLHSATELKAAESPKRHETQSKRRPPWRASRFPLGDILVTISWHLLFERSQNRPLGGGRAMPGLSRAVARDDVYHSPLWEAAKSQDPRT